MLHMEPVLRKGISGRQIFPFLGTENYRSMRRNILNTLILMTAYFRLQLLKK